MPAKSGHRSRALVANKQEFVGRLRGKEIIRNAAVKTHFSKINRTVDPEPRSRETKHTNYLIRCECHAICCPKNCRCRRLCRCAGKVQTMLSEAVGLHSQVVSPPHGKFSMPSIVDQSSPEHVSESAEKHQAIFRSSFISSAVKLPEELNSECKQPSLFA